MAYLGQDSAAFTDINIFPVFRESGFCGANRKRDRRRRKGGHPFLRR